MSVNGSVVVSACCVGDKFPVVCDADSTRYQ